MRRLRFDLSCFALAALLLALFVTLAPAQQWGSCGAPVGATYAGGFGGYQQPAYQPQAYQPQAYYAPPAAYGYADPGGGCQGAGMMTGQPSYGCQGGAGAAYTYAPTYSYTFAPQPAYGCSGAYAGGGCQGGGRAYGCQGAYAGGCQGGTAYGCSGGAAGYAGRPGLFGRRYALAAAYGR